LLCAPAARMRNQEGKCFFLRHFPLVLFFAFAASVFSDVFVFFFDYTVWNKIPCAMRTFFKS
jgi:hypothetical protein